MSKRRKFSAEFKRGAVEQASQPGVSCAQVARELGIRDTLLTRWRREAGGPESGKVADRGSPFRSGDYQRYLVANGLVCSMSAVGHCGDNAAGEGFFGMLKRERVHRMTYPTLDAARADLFEYIERLHNPRMRRRVARQDQKLSTLPQPSVISGQNPLRSRADSDKTSGPTPTRGASHPLRSLCSFCAPAEI